MSVTQYNSIISNYTCIVIQNYFILSKTNFESLFKYFIRYLYGINENSGYAQLIDTCGNEGFKYNPSYLKVKLA